MKAFNTSQRKFVIFALASFVLLAWSPQGQALNIKDATDNTPIYKIDGSSFVIRVASEDIINTALAKFSGYRSMTPFDRQELRYTLKTSFVEGLSGVQANIPAMGLANAGKAVCTLNYKNGSTTDSQDFVTAKNQILTAENGSEQSIGFDGAIYLKDQYFFIYCQQKDSNLTVGYFNRAFQGVLKLQPTQP